jgi:SMI1/KNR4 family protein SUKH-1
VISVPVERLRVFWDSLGAQPRPGITSADVRACEERIGRALPEDVASFYRSVNGTVETAHWLFEVWPLERVGSVEDVVTSFSGIPDYSQIGRILPSASEYFAFADCMIWSHVFAVRLVPEEATEVVWLCGPRYTVIAPTFAAFWELYLSDPDAALFAKGALVQPSA